MHLHLLLFTLLSCWFTGNAEIKTDHVLAKYQHAVAQAAPANLTARIDNGNKLAEKYSTKEFLEPILEPEKVHAEQQKLFNETILYSANLPIGDIRVPLALANADVARFGMLGCAWTIEWWLYSVATKSFVQTHAAHCASKADEILATISTIKQNPSPEAAEQLSNLLTMPTSSLGFPRLTSKMLGTLVVYLMLNTAMQHVHNYIQLPEPASVDYIALACGQKLEQPITISSLIPWPLMHVITLYGSPQSLTSTINSWFKQFGLLPSWHDHIALQMAKEFCVLMLWLRWETKSIQQRWHSYVLEHKQDIEKLMLTIKSAQTQSEKEAITTAQEQLQNFIQTSMQLSFTSWISLKILHVSFWQSMANIIIATPAWYKIGSWLYQTYNAVTKPPEHKESA